MMGGVGNGDCLGVRGNSRAWALLMSKGCGGVMGDVRAVVICAHGIGQIRGWPGVASS